MKIFKIQIEARYQIEAASMTVYRGVKDTPPSMIDHRYAGEGVFGRGTYYALEENDALGYAIGGFGGNGEEFHAYAMVFEFRLAPQNPLKLNPLDAYGISSHSDPMMFTPRGAKKIKEKERFKVARDKLGELATKKKFDCVILTSDWDDDDREGGHTNTVDGGDQVLIPLKSSLQPKLVRFDIMFPQEHEDLAAAVHAKLKSGKLQTTEEGYPAIYGITPAKLKPLGKILEEVKAANPDLANDDGDEW